MESALATATAWGNSSAPRGMVFATYKATCRREGCFRGKRGSHDLNGELLQPMADRLAGRWNQTFKTPVRRCVAHFIYNASKGFTQFHQEAIAAAKESGGGRIELLKRQFQPRKKEIEDAGTKACITIKRHREDAHRNLKLCIQETMNPGYQDILAQSGITPSGRSSSCLPH